MNHPEVDCTPVILAQNEPFATTRKRRYSHGIQPLDMIR